MRTELHTSSRAAALLVPLTERLAAMSAPCPMHPSVHRIEAALLAWSRGLGLEVDRGAGVHRLAGRAMARCDTGAATLFARWLAWLLRFREESDAYAGVLAVAEGCEPGPRTVERAFASLWRESAPGMSEQWRERFLAHLTSQRAALLDAGPAARDRAACGPCLFDVVEPCLGVEVPGGLPADREWRALDEAACDVVAWCDGLAAREGRTAAPSPGGPPGARGTGARGAGARGAGARTPRTREAGPPGAETRGIEGQEVEAWEVERLVARMEELWTAARTVPVLVERHGLGLAAGRDVTRVACAFLTVSRAHLERLLEGAGRLPA
ncbi:hypothetical protein GCM10010466_41700 [Planomonospora alba]|uniref:Sigma-70 family RNA polymerase sigma factor n=1 Tax=Planomonospora alba TaxID=161354 RepID=A0ABP6NFD8_9ACTN